MLSGFQFGVLSLLSCLKWCVSLADSSDCATFLTTYRLINTENAFGRPRLSTTFMTRVRPVLCIMCIVYIQDKCWPITQYHPACTVITSAKQ